MVVQANVRGRDLGGFVTDAQTKVDQIQLPPGVRLTWGGQFENLKRAEQRLGLVIPIVFVLIGVLLFMALGSFSEAGLVFACVPLALIGGRLGASHARDAVLGVCGRWLHRRLGCGDPERTCFDAGHSRAIAGGARAPGRGDRRGVQPIACGVDDSLGRHCRLHPDGARPRAGAEVQKPLATVVIGGLLTATALTLLVLPTFAAKAVRHRKDEGVED